MEAFSSASEFWFWRTGEEGVSGGEGEGVGGREGGFDRYFEATSVDS